MIALAVFNSRAQVLIFARYLERNLIGATCGTSYTFRKGEFQLPLTTRSFNWTLVCGFYQPLPFFNLIPSPHLPRRRVNLFESLAGTTISNILVHKTDRIIVLCLDSGKHFLVLQLFGVNGNILSYDSQRMLLSSFKKLKKEPTIDWENCVPLGELPFSWDQYLRDINTNSDQTLAAFLSSGLWGVYSKTFLMECALRLQLDPQTRVGNLTSVQHSQLFTILMELFSPTTFPQFYLYTAEPPRLSFILLRQTGLPQPLQYDDYSQAVNNYSQIYRRWERLNRTRFDLQRQLTTLQTRLTRKLHKQRQELTQLATVDFYYRIGDLLMANLPRLTKGDKTVEIPLGDDGREIMQTIELDPRLTPVANAQKYYNRARREKEAREQLTRSIIATEKQLQQIAELNQAIADGADFSSLTEHIRSLLATTKGENEPQSQRQPYYQFEFNAWSILVGRSARDNDILTHELARPNDWWFHAQHVTGSHVIVRNPNKKELPHAIIVKAAAIAAYYSRARNSALVPVIYTQKKYVSKPRQSSPGTAAVKYEKVILVEPWNPQKEDCSSC